MTSKITLAGGCFWCIEAALKTVNGVTKTTPGYTGGTTENPSYHEVCSGNTGHAEAVQIEYKEKQITLKQLLNLFFKIHNPTTKNQQGPDKGTQYRSAIYYEKEKQKQAINEVIQKLEEKVYGENMIVTEVEPLNKFYEAEEEHHNYFEKNPESAYCRINIPPKISKIQEENK